MYLDGLNNKFTNLDKELRKHIKEVHLKMYEEAKNMALTKSKYKVNSIFNHPSYGLCTIRDIDISLNRNLDPHLSFDVMNIVIENNEYYKPYYLYLIYSEEFDNIGYLRLTELELDKYYK